MRVLVTGAAGFIGSWVSETSPGAMGSLGSTILILFDPAVKEQNVREVVDSDQDGRFRLVRADIVHDDSAMNSLFSDPKASLYHLSPCCMGRCSSFDRSASDLYK